MGVIWVGDCLRVMAEMPEASVTAVVTDPPYGLEFMGQEWDKFSPVKPTLRSGWDHAYASAHLGGGGGGSRGGMPFFGKRRRTSRCKDCGRRDAFRNDHGCSGEWSREYVDEQPTEALAFQEWTRLWALEAYRVLRPGGTLLAFGGTRMFHRMGCGIEDAGFEIRDCLMWLHGSGFPKSLDVSKALDKAAGAEREVVGERRFADGTKGRRTAGDFDGQPSRSIERTHVTAPATDAARTWEGYGTALKPAWEPIVVAMKPLAGTFARNALEHGVAGLNVDGARVGVSDSAYARNCSGDRGHDTSGRGRGPGFQMSGGSASSGRWPANLVLDEEAAAQLDEQSGELHGAGFVNPGPRSDKRNVTNAVGGGPAPPHDFGDSGGASRFFYVAKATRAERERGLVEHLPCVRCGGVSTATHRLPGEPRVHCSRNAHPTVKPVELMRWLVRLVTMPEGTVILDPFLGSGSTAVACVREAVEFVGVERDPKWARVALRRAAASRGLLGTETELRRWRARLRV